MSTSINLKKNISISLFTRILSMLLGFVSSIIITRYLGPELKGKMSYFLALSGTIWMILDLGFHKSLPFILARDKKVKSQILSFGVFLHILDLVFLIIVFTIFKEYFYIRLEVDNFIYLLCFIIFTAITHFGFIIKFVMVGVNEILWQNLLKFLPSLFYIILFFIFKLFIEVQDKYLYVLMMMILANIIWTYYYAIKLFIVAKIKFVYRFDIKLLLQVYQLGIKAFLSGFFIFLLIRFDIFIIKKYTTFVELGFYALAANFVTLLQSFTNMTGSLMLPKFAGENNSDKSIIILKRMIIIFSLMFILIALFFKLFGTKVIVTVYGPEFIRSAKVFSLLLPAVLFLAVGSLLNTFFCSKGFPLTTILLPIIALVINVVLNLILIPKIGISGAAVATSISYFLWMILLIIYFFNSKLVENPRLLFFNFDDFKFLYSEAFGRFKSKRK